MARLESVIGQNEASITKLRDIKQQTNIQTTNYFSI